MKTYTPAELRELRDAAAAAAKPALPASFAPPAEVNAALVARPTVKRKAKKDGPAAAAAAAAAPVSAAPGAERDAFGADERAKLSVVQQLVKERQPRVALRVESKKPEQPKPEPPRAGSRSASPLWVPVRRTPADKQQQQQPDPLVVVPSPDAKLKALNPDAAPFVASFEPPPMPMLFPGYAPPPFIPAPMVQSFGTSPTKDAKAPKGEPSNDDDDDGDKPEAGGKPERAFNPEAVPFTPTQPKAVALAAGGEDDEDEEDDDDNSSGPPWGSDVELPPVPQGKQKKKIETDQYKLKQRQKQVRIGLHTCGYKNYLRAKEVGFDFKEKFAEPVTPNIYQVCSKRAWDGQIRKWRQQLHKFDDLTDELWPEEGAKAVRELNAKHERFKDKVRRQAAEREQDAMEQLGLLGGGGFMGYPTLFGMYPVPGVVPMPFYPAWTPPAEETVPAGAGEKVSAEAEAGEKPCDAAEEEETAPQPEQGQEQEAPAAEVEAAA